MRNNSSPEEHARRATEAERKLAIEASYFDSSRMAYAGLTHYELFCLELGVLDECLRSTGSVTAVDEARLARWNKVREVMHMKLRQALGNNVMPGQR